MALDVVSSQLTPWLVALPVMLLLLIVLLSRELKPLKKLAQTLRSRSPDATDAADGGCPRKCAPARRAESSLRAHQEMMTRERRFTSDAAHELRSPLAALKVQTDVAQLSGRSAGAGKSAGAAACGIDRASRLVDQLLTLSRLDSLDNLDDVEPIRWPICCSRRCWISGIRRSRRALIFA
jgi:two-component system sensor histidine kinase QseC